MRRAPLAEVQAHAWVTSPQEGDQVQAGTVAFTGYGTSFEANFTWVVRNSAGATVAQGHAMGGTGTGGFGEFTFTARLAPGRYSVEVSTDDPSGGAEGRGPATDDKTFTVR
jgi:Immunoglobulin-like domain of bacterial spore germination